MPRSQRTHAPRHVALLRGINVGGKRVLPMAALAEIFTEAGCGDVCTYVQSGNVAFSSSAQATARLPSEIADRIEARFGFQVPVLLRGRAELQAIVTGNPFLHAGAAPEALHVAFLADTPSRRHAAALDSKRSPGDSFELVGRELYLHLPNGVARTKLTNAYFDATLATTSTLRNWRTVLELFLLTDPSG